MIAGIVGMPALDVPGFPAHQNTNLLVGADGITGIKTGTLDGAGSSLLFSASIDVGLEAPLSVVGAALGSWDRSLLNDDVRRLLGSIRAGFNDVSLLREGEELGTYSTPWGDDAPIVVSKDASLFTWSDTPIAMTSETFQIDTGSSGTEVGSVTFQSGNSTVTVPLVLAGSIEEPDAWWRLTHPFELIGG